MLKSKLFGKKLGFQEVQFSCTVNFLSEQESLTVAYNKELLGEEVFERVCRHLNLAEKHFFGLRCLDLQNQRFWLDLKKPIQKQLKNVNPPELNFRVKYYPSDPSRLKEQLTRYLLFLQLERDLKHGRLLCSSSELIHLSALQLQAKFGGAVVDSEDTDLSKILSKNARYIINEILLQRNSLLDMGVAEAEMKFVQYCGRLPTYGVDPTPARDVMGEIVFVGVNHGGVMVLKEGKVAVSIPWKEINRLDYHGKLLSVQCKSSKGGSSTQHLKCAGADVCKLLWKLLVDQQSFFTLDWSGDARKVKANRGLFRRTSSFRFKGLCESDVWRSVTSLNRIEPPVLRSFSGLSHNLSGSQSVPPSIMQTSYHTDYSGSLRSVSPLASPLLLRRLEASPEEDEDVTPKADEDGEKKRLTNFNPEVALPDKTQAGTCGADDDFHSMSEHSRLDDDDDDVINADVTTTTTSSSSSPPTHTLKMADEPVMLKKRRVEGGGEMKGEGGKEGVDGVVREGGVVGGGVGVVVKERRGDLFPDGFRSYVDHYLFKHLIVILIIAILYALFKLYLTF